MTIELDHDIKRALGLALQILEDQPDWLQPYSNMRDMKKMLAGGTTHRDHLIVSEAIAVALAWRTMEIVESPPVTLENAEVGIGRINEFMALFAAAQRADIATLGSSYAAMCDRLARSREGSAS